MGFGDKRRIHAKKAGLKPTPPKGVSKLPMVDSMPEVPRKKAPEPPPREEREEQPTRADKPAANMNKMSLKTEVDSEARTNELNTSDILGDSALIGIPPSSTHKQYDPEIKSSLEDFQTRFDQIKQSSSTLSPDKLLDKLRIFQEDIWKFLREKAQEGVRREELEEIESLIASVDKYYRELMNQLKAQMEFEAQRAAAKAQQQSLSLSIDSPDSIQSNVRENETGFKRFITSPVTWAVTMFSAFTGFLFWQKAFKDIAEGIGKLLKTTPPSEKAIMVSYGAFSVMVFAVVTVVVNYIQNKKADKKTELEQLRQGGGPTE